MSTLRVELVPLDKITFPPQERKHYGKDELQWLADTIAVHGVLEPVGVRPEGADGYVLRWGQRRCMASTLVGLKTIPAVVSDRPITEAEAIEIRLIENVAREGLRPLELASGLDQMMRAAKLTASEVAKRVGMNPASVTKSLSLLRLPPELREHVDAGRIPAATGYALSKVDDRDLQLQLGAQAAEGKLTRDGLDGRLRAAGRPEPSKDRHPSRVTAKLAGGRVVTVAAADLTLESLIATLEDLLNRCRSARPKGLSLRTLLTVLADEAAQPSSPT